MLDADSLNGRAAADRNGSSPNRAVKAALAYHRRGWHVTPLEGKAAKTPDWANAQFDETEIPGKFAGKNVGVVLGRAAGGLVDVDLDCAEGLSLAAAFLPKTPARFGRKSSPHSHRIYRIESPTDIKSLRFADPETQQNAAGDHKGAIVELRGDGCQTMFPGSMHPSGESVAWDIEDAEPAIVELERLRNSVRRLAAAILIVRRWIKLPRHDAALALTGVLLKAGWSDEVTEHFVLTVAADEEPEDRRRAVADTVKKFKAGAAVAGYAKCLELFGDRTWLKIAEWLNLSSDGSQAFEEFDASIINTSRRPAPELPLDVLGPRWSYWVTAQADATSAPVDYLFGPLLAGAAALIGNARVISAFDGSWKQPSILWVMSIGDPSSRKSPAAEPIHQPLMELEKELLPGYVDELRVWESNCERARAQREQWKASLRKDKEVNRAVREDAKAALDQEGIVGDLPASAFEPERPQRPRIMMRDATPEALVNALSGLPKGLMLYRDELAGWLEGMGRYTAGKSNGERSLYTEAYGAQLHTVDRAGAKGAPVVIEKMSVSIGGTIQPERLNTLFFKGDNDGFASRFIPLWPDRVRFQRPAVDALPTSPVLASLRKLRDLTMESYRALPLTEEANQALATWYQTNEDAVARSSGLFQSFLGKLPGVVLRLALVLTYLRWCAEDAVQEPESVGVEMLLAVIHLVDNYVVPMAARVYGDASLPDAETDAAAIARLIVVQDRTIGATRSDGSYYINQRKVCKRRINRIRSADHARAALEELRAAGWIHPAAMATGGRPRGDYEVNPAVFEIKEQTPQPQTRRVMGEPWRSKKLKY